jgi:hypothetical protein
VHAKQEGPRQRDTELQADDAVDRRSVQRTEAQALDRERALEVENVLRPTGSERGEHTEGLAAQPAKRELEHCGTRTVQPLNVVDGDKDGA